MLESKSPRIKNHSNYLILSKQCCSEQPVRGAFLSDANEPRPTLPPLLWGCANVSTALSYNDDC